MTGTFDVTTLHGRRADRRWNRMVVGDVLERLTWSRPDKAAIVGRPGAFGSPDFASLTYRRADAAASQSLAGYECPKRIFFVDAMPETVGGKILKYQLRQRFC